VPVVVFLPTAEPREVAQCYQAGASSCVRKPVELEEFQTTLRSVARYWLELNQTAYAAGQRVGGAAGG
jgi:CheY-like chemotaxis protein